MNFKIAKSKTDKPLFWQYDEFVSFNSCKRYTNITFDKFLNVMNDYYLIKFSSSLSRNAWLVFCWLRSVSYEDGFVQDSYDSLVSLFCKYGGTKISKPTFFKCISELEKADLIVSIGTKDKNLSGKNIYCICDKTYIVYQLCDIIDGKVNMPTAMALDILEHKKQNTLFDVDENTPPKTAKKKRHKLSDDKRYSLLMKSFFRPISNEIEDFFTFIGSYNRTGRISVSRKVKILLGLKEYLACDFELSDFVYAFNLTMKNTVRGNNPYRERYMFKVLENMCEYEDVDNEVADELSKKAEKKLSSQHQKPHYQSRPSISKVEYDSEKQKLMRVEKHYRFVIDRYSKDAPISEYEDNLYRLALAIKKKFDAYSANGDIDYERMMYLRGLGYFEYFSYDSKWNRVFAWKTDDGKVLSKKDAKSLLGDKYPFTIYDKISEEV